MYFLLIWTDLFFLYKMYNHKVSSENVWRYFGSHHTPSLSLDYQLFLSSCLQKLEREQEQEPVSRLFVAAWTNNKTEMVLGSRSIKKKVL